MNDHLDWYVYVRPNRAMPRLVRTLSIQRDSKLTESQRVAALERVQAKHPRAQVLVARAVSWTAADLLIRQEVKGAELEAMPEGRRARNPDARTSGASSSQIRDKARLVLVAAIKVGGMPARSTTELLDLSNAVAFGSDADVRRASVNVLDEPGIKRKREMHTALDRALELLATVLRRTGHTNPIKKSIDRRSVRSVGKGKKRVLVGCPKGKYSARRKRCKVGTRAAETARRKKNPGAASTGARASGSPASAQIAAGARTFKRWHGFDPERIEVVSGNRKVPRTLVLLGTLPEIVYDSNKWSGRMERYVHKTGRSNPPLLCTGPDGKGLYIVGGSVRVTRRGLIG